MKKKVINKSIGYIRVSTEEQAKEGYSIPAQKAKILSYCEEKNFNIENIVIDAGVTSDVPFTEREGGAEIIKNIESNEIDRVVTIKLDRMFRVADECISTVKKWNKKGVVVSFIDRTEYRTDPIGKAQFGIQAILNELEKDQIKERTKTAMEHMKKNGKYTGGKVIFGFRINEHNELEPYPPEQKIIDIVMECYNNQISVYRIIQILKQQNMKSRTGNDFSKSQIKKIIQNYSLTEKAKSRKPNTDPINQYTGEKK